MKSDRLLNIMATLALSEAELDECNDVRSIRNTCRKLLRRIFQKELADPNIHFGKILKENSSKTTAIRRKFKTIYITNNSCLVFFL